MKLSQPPIPLDAGSGDREAPGIPAPQTGPAANRHCLYSPEMAPAVLDAVGVLVVVVSPDGRILHANHECLHSFGQDATSIQGRELWSLLPVPRDARCLQEMLETLLAGKQAPPQTLHCGCVNGCDKPMEWTGATIPDAAGKTHCIVFTGIDLSEHRHMEEALSDSQARSRAIFEAAVDGIVTIDEHGNIEAVNPSMQRMLGYDEGDLPGQNIKILMPRPYRDSHDDYLERYLVTGEKRIIGIGREVVICRKDGTTFPADLAVSEVHLGHRRIFTGIVRDITERKRAEREMTRLRLNQQSIIDSMPSILLGVDRDGRVNVWNRQAEEATGIHAAIALGHFFGDFFAYLQDQLERVQIAIHRGEPLRTKRIAHLVDGETRYSDVMVYPLIAGGAAGAVIRVDDVTARVRIDEMMVQSEKMLSVGGLAAGMAHEINNPLGAVIQSCQNIVRRVSPELHKNNEVAASIGVDLEMVRRYLEARSILRFIEQIQESAQRAAKIVTDMLSFSRRSEEQRAPARLDDLLDASLRLAASDYELKKQYKFKHIKIKRDYSHKLERIYCDRSGIEQVILNLLKNAAQALAGYEGERPPKITLRTRKEQGFARIDIIDNGPGMDEQVRRRVFEPFYTTKAVGVGTGLGLWVSYFIITDQHKGSLIVESAPGHGARFTIRLPLRSRAH